MKVYKSAFFLSIGSQSLKRLLMAVVLVFCLFLRKFFKGFPRAKKLKILFRVSWGNSASKEAEPGLEVFELEIVSQILFISFYGFP